MKVSQGIHYWLEYHTTCIQNGRGCCPCPAPLIHCGYYLHRSFDLMSESNRICFYYKI